MSDYVLPEELEVRLQPHQKKTFFCHAAILSNASVRMADLLQGQDVAPGQRRELTFYHVSESAMCVMLQYCYSGLTPNLSQSAMELMRFSKEVLLPDLSLRAQRALEPQIDQENLAMWLTFASRNEGVHLLNRCFDFIKEHSITLKNVKNWREVETCYPSLISEVNSVISKLHAVYINTLLFYLKKNRSHSIISRHQKRRARKKRNERSTCLHKTITTGNRVQKNGHPKNRANKRI